MESTACVNIERSSKNSALSSTLALEINNEKFGEIKVTTMEVEERNPVESTLVIEIDDDESDVGDTTQNSYQDEKPSEDSLLEVEKSSTKTVEPADQTGRTSEDSEIGGSYGGPDPMGLLEQINCFQEASDDNEMGQSADWTSSTDSRRVKRRQVWQCWMKRWPWLLHEESDGEYAFCLYCNVIINVNKNITYLYQHSRSVYHQERESNYLAFKNSEEYKLDCNGDEEMEHELGTDSYAAAMKEKRASEVKSLNNFNWQRWLSWHPWLERVGTEGTIGECVYCNLRMNVEFAYLRKRHESNKLHCEAQREKENLKRKRSLSRNESTPDEDQDDEDASTTRYQEKSEWCEMHPDGNMNMCRCTLCDLQMVVSSFGRHLQTKAHAQNLRLYEEKQQAEMERGVYAQYAEQHPWLVAHPDDPSMAYCKVCCRRFVYGHSEKKRIKHEISERHKANAAALTSPNGGQTEESDTSQFEMEAEVSENEGAEYTPQSGNEAVTEKPEKPGKSKQLVPHFPWIRKATRDTRMLRSLKTEPVVKTEPHGNADAVEKKGSRNAKLKPVPTTLHGKLMLWRERLPWLSYKRNETRDNYGWCKLCEVSVFLPTFKIASKHQRSSRHIRLRKERKQAALASSAAAMTGEESQKAAMAELQAKYNWVEPDENNENFCYCKVCEVRLPIKLFFLSQHDASRKHQEHLKNSSQASITAMSDAAPAASSMEINEGSDEGLSTQSECSTEDQPPSKRMRRATELRRLLRALRDSVGKRTNERNQLDMAKDMISSSFDIVSRLRTLERENESHAPGSSHNCSASNIPVVRPRDTMELFFESISQTMKGLPIDLAAEGKAKIMQVVCDLELRSVKRKSTFAQEEGTSTKATSTSLTAENVPNDGEETSGEVSQESLASPDSQAPSTNANITLNEQQSNGLSNQRLSTNKPNSTKQSELSVTPKKIPTVEVKKSKSPKAQAETEEPKVVPQNGSMFAMPKKNLTALKVRESPRQNAVNDLCQSTSSAENGKEANQITRSSTTNPFTTVHHLILKNLAANGSVSKRLRRTSSTSPVSITPQNGEQHNQKPQLRSSNGSGITPTQPQSKNPGKNQQQSSNANRAMAHRSSRT